MNNNKQPHLHRELMPARQCKTQGCGCWLTSANEDDYCAACGGWVTQRLSATDAWEATAELYAELIGASPGEAVANNSAAHRPTRRRGPCDRHSLARPQGWRLRTARTPQPHSWTAPSRRMTFKALRTRSALKLAPWLKPKGREWTISGAPFASANAIDSEASAAIAEARQAKQRQEAREIFDRLRPFTKELP